MKPLPTYWTNYGWSYTGKAFTFWSWNGEYANSKTSYWSKSRRTK